MDKEKAQELISKKIKDLPTLPDIVHKLVTLMQDQKASMSSISKLISYDQAISLRLLKVANSAYYGFLREVATIQHAIALLGLDEVKRLSLGIAMLNFLRGTNDNSSHEIENFWRHSVGCSLAAHIICKKIGVESEIIHTASLLHDVGKLALSSLYGKEYKSVREKVDTEGINTLDAENEILGFGHSDVGLWLCNKWKLPSSVIAPIAYHHKVDEAQKEDIINVSIVHLADIVCYGAGIGNNGNCAVPLFNKAAKDKLHIEERDIDNMTKDLQGEEEKVQAFMNSIQ